jgi:hypothetical protein
MTLNERHLRTLGMNTAIGRLNRWVRRLISVRTMGLVFSNSVGTPGN